MSTEERIAGAAGGRSPLEELRSLQIDRGPATSSGPPTPGARKSRRWLGWLVVLVLAAAALVFARGPLVRLYAERTGSPPETLVLVRTGGTPIVLTATGYVNADAIVVVGTTISGRLRTLLVDKGDRVKRGQLVAQIEDDELRAELGVQQANVAKDEINLRRQETLAKGNATTQEALDNARSQLDTDKANLQLTLARLRQTRIVAPIDGKVLERLAEPGDIVAPMGPAAPNSGILRLADLRKTVVEVDVSEADLRRLLRGQPADVLLDAFPGHIYRATLHEFAQVADKAKAALQVKVLLAAPDENVRPGMSAKVIFRPTGQAASEPGQLVIPRRALLPDERSVYVVAAGGRIEKRPVEVKPAKDADQVEVVRGLEEGETLALGELGRLRPGDKLPGKKD